jgi:hypothetical protein
MFLPRIAEWSPDSGRDHHLRDLALIWEGAMNKHHEQLLEAVHHAMTALFSDTSVSRSQTRDDLKEIIDQAFLLIESIEHD